MNKRVLVTGGAGFIGSAIIKNLQKLGHEILVYDNLSFGKRDFLTIDDSYFVEGDILDLGTLERVFFQFSPHYVLHLAAIHFIPFCNEHPYISSKINIIGTANVLECCKKLPGLEKVLFASTAAVYPIHDDATSETLKTAPSDIYGLSKFAGEELCHKFFLETNIPTIICRFFNAFGPNETNPHLIPEIQQQVLIGKRTLKLGNTQPKRDFIHTYDMAHAVHLLLEKFEQGIDTFNLGRGIEYSVLEVVSAFEKALGEKLMIETDPMKVRKSDRLHLLADIEKIKSFTGWEPGISLEEGIKTLVTAYDA